MRFRIDAPATSTRRFRLPDERSTAPELPVEDRPFTPHVWGPGLATQPHKRQITAQTPRGRLGEAQAGSRGLFTVKAPVGPRKGRTILDFTAATDAEMPSFMGTIRLQIDRDSVDLGRLSGGVMALAIDHDTTQLMGRVVEATVYPGRLGMLAEVSETPTATNTMAEIADLTRQGFSPGFLIHEVRILDEDDDEYYPDQYLQVICTRWEPYEISSTAIPRNRDAKLRGVASMSDAIMGAPELVSTSDLLGLSLAAGRQVVASGKGSAAQRAKLQQFFRLFDTGLENGLTRDKAATAAKLIVGL